MQAVQNDRTYVGHYVKPHGVQIEARIEKYKIGLYNTLYAGGCLMPYYSSYASSLYTGSPFYRTRDDVYNRLEAYWYPFQNEKFDLKVSSVHHYDGDMFKKESPVRKQLRFRKNKKSSSNEI